MTGNRNRTERLLAELSPAARRKYLELVLAQDFSAFVMKVFETVLPAMNFYQIGISTP